MTQLTSVELAIHNTRIVRLKSPQNREYRISVNLWSRCWSVRRISGSSSGEIEGSELVGWKDCTVMHKVFRTQLSVYTSYWFHNWSNHLPVSVHYGQDSDSQEAYHEVQVCYISFYTRMENNRPSCCCFTGAISPIVTTVSRRHGGNQRVLITESGVVSRGRHLCRRYAEHIPAVRMNP